MLRLKELREQHDPPMTQEGLAYAAGLSIGTVRRAEKTGSANTATLRKLADALDVNVGDLFQKATA